MRARPVGRRGLRGFTLLETLVTLAIAAAVSALLWQAMQQVARVEHLLQSSGADRQRLAGSSQPPPRPTRYEPMGGP